MQTDTQKQLKIKTKRLTLIPLTANQMVLWTQDLQALEGELNVKYLAEDMDEFFIGIIKSQIAPTKNAGDNYFWHGFWLIARNDDGVVVGSCDFKNAPDNENKVEIGYGLGKRFFHNGYMTEAVGAICDFAFSKGVNKVIAETLIDNDASQNVLKRCGFKEYEKGTSIWWELKSNY